MYDVKFKLKAVDLAKKSIVAATREFRMDQKQIYNRYICDTLE